MDLATRVTESTASIPIDSDARRLLDGAALTCVERFLQWVQAHAPDYGTPVKDVRVRRWRSVEDPEWVQVVVDVTVAGDSDAAQRFWDVAIDRLAALTEAECAPAAEMLTVHVHRR